MSLSAIVPRERRANVVYRGKLLSRCERDDRLRLAMIAGCREDVLFFLNTFAWLYEPRRSGSKAIPFCTYPFQDEALLKMQSCVEGNRDLVIEKSRDMGASWMCMSLFVWNWLFRPYQSFLCVSRKEDLVENEGNMDALFSKVDFILNHLPGWMLPAVQKRKLSRKNLENGSVLVGESTTGVSGVGGRHTAMLVDEFSLMPDGDKLYAGTADTTGCRIFNFTYWGRDNAAYRLGRRNDVEKLRMHWSIHPEKAKGLYYWDKKSKSLVIVDEKYEFPVDYHFVMDGKQRSPWYDAECKRRANDRDVAAQLDIDPQGTDALFFDRGTVMDLVDSYGRQPVWEGELKYDTVTGEPEGLVFRSGGWIRAWRPPNADGVWPACRWAAGADIAMGEGATPSVLSVGDADTGEMVIEMASPYWRPYDFASRCVAFLRWLTRSGCGQPMFAWESAGPGRTFGKRVSELNYGAVYLRNYESAPAGMKSGPSEAGWVPTPDSKRQLLEDFREALSNRYCLVRSREMLEECLDFAYTKQGAVEHSGGKLSGGDPTGAGDNHGDRVIAGALMWKAMKFLLGGKNPAISKMKTPEVAAARTMAGRRRMAEPMDDLCNRW